MPTQKKQHYLTEPSEHFFYAIDIKQFGDPDQFFDTLDAAVADMHALEPSEGFDKVRLPGEREWERAQCRRSDGVPLHKDTVSALTELASRMSLELPW